MTKYTYSKIINEAKLAKEITTSSITTAFDHIDVLTGSTTINVWFKADLSGGEVTTLNALVAAHDSTGIPEVKMTGVTDTSSNLRVTMQPRVGSGLTLITHNFADPKSWYSNATRVVDKILSPTIGGVYDTYSFADEVIDMENGRITFEDRIKDSTTGLSYLPIVKVNDVVVTTGYTKDYVANTLTFSTPLIETDVVKATFYKVNDSMFVIKPASGKQIKMENVEVQFSIDANFLNRWIVFETWVYNPYDIPNKVLYDRATYKCVRDYINESNNKTSVVMQAIGELSKQVQIFTWEYPASRVVKSSQGVEIRIYVKDKATGVKNLPVIAKDGSALEVATATFYSLVETE